MRRAALEKILGLKVKTERCSTVTSILPTTPTVLDSTAAALHLRVWNKYRMDCDYHEYVAPHD